MLRAHPRITTALMLTLPLIACALPALGVAPTPTPVPAADLEVADQRPVSISGAHVWSLSPDGNWLAGIAERTLCVYDAQSLKKKTCADIEFGVDPGSLAWSPDSARIAFCEDWMRYWVEADVWTLEVETGKTVNLTDDGSEGSVLRLLKDHTFALDGTPAWSPDGRSIAFARATWGNSSRATALYRIPSNGGEAREVAVLADEEERVTVIALRWPGQGAELLYTLAYAALEDPHNGLWAISPDGGEPDHLARLNDAERGFPFLLDVSRDGRWALVRYSNSMMMGGASRPFYCALVDVQEGTAEPLKGAAEVGQVFNAACGATFSPDGSRVLYTYGLVGERPRVAVRAVDDDTEYLLVDSYDGPFLGMREGRFGLGLDWADKGTVLALLPGPNGVLLELRP